MSLLVAEIGEVGDGAAWLGFRGELVAGYRLHFNEPQTGRCQQTQAVPDILPTMHHSLSVCGHTSIFSPAIWFKCSKGKIREEKKANKNKTTEGKKEQMLEVWQSKWKNRIIHYPLSNYKRQSTSALLFLNTNNRNGTNLNIFSKSNTTNL